MSSDTGNNRVAYLVSFLDPWWLLAVWGFYISGKQKSEKLCV